MYKFDTIKVYTIKAGQKESNVFFTCLITNKFVSMQV